MENYKRQIRYKFNCDEKGDTLILVQIKIEEVYTDSHPPCVPGKVNPTLTPVSSTSTEVNRYILHQTTPEEVELWRNEDPGARGIIFRKGNRIYSCKIDEKEIDLIQLYGNGATHLCGANCKSLCPKDSMPCPKILNVKCNHIEKYDFITEGYEIFAPQMQSTFFVFKCANYNK